MPTCSRHGALAAAALILSACPALLEDDFEAIERTGGASSTGAGTGPAGAPGEPAGAAGTERVTLSGGSSGAAGAGATSAGGAPSGGVPSGGAGGMPSGGAGGTPSGGTSGVGATGGQGGSGGGPGGSAGRGGAGGEARSGGEGGTAPGGAGGVTHAGAGGEAGAGGAVQPLCPTAPADCEVLLGSLRHRYRFDGIGTSVIDSIGGADGIVRGGATLEGAGELALDGGSSGQYVDLPNGLISVLEDATLELWVVWNGGVAWQRVFDFGDAMASTCYSGGSTAPEGQPGACGRTFLNLTPATDSSSGSIARVAFMRQPGDPTTQSLLVDGPRLAVHTEVQLVVVVDDSQDELRLYVDGQLHGSEAFVDHLADVNDINNWLGRSQFSSDSDQYFGGVYRELRIYGAALGDGQVATSFAEGPDPRFLE